MSTLPMAVYGLEVPAGDVAIPAIVDIPAAFRITMAAIDPSAEPEESGVTEGSKPRATLKLIRQPLLADDYDEDDSDFDADAMDKLLAGVMEDSGSDSEDEEEELNGGPSDPTKSRKARKAAAVAALKKSLEEEDEEMLEATSKGKGKGALTNGVEEDDEESDSDDEEGFEPEEFVICTLDPERMYQQPLDITIGEDERVWFKVSGTHTIYLTGNYVEPADAHDHEYDSEDSEDDYDADEYDLTPDEDELDDEDELSEDELDDLPRIMEVDDEEEAPELVAPVKKGKETKGKKRAAEDSDDAATLDDMISKAQKASGETNGEAKLSKKQAKKLKNNEGKAVAAEKEATKEEPSSAKSDKKVSFAEKLETGPTPSPASKDKASATGARVVQGVTIDVKKVGEGDEAKKGDRIGMRYIGKLLDGKVFDSNKKGKPFSFKLGIGEVIKGWDVGVAGIRVGGERRITVPAHQGYGGKAIPGIPANSTLIFDIKCVEIKKK